ncbi:MAG TPA: hypothetical protein VIK72_19420 [Clostridiaceae bacterium]
MSIVNLISTEIEEGLATGYTEITTHKGITRGSKALVVIDNEYNNNFTVGMLNLATMDKEILFDLLDKTLHDKFETREYMQERIEELENRNSDLEDALEECSAGSVLDNFDCEYDFYQAN